MAYWTRGVTNRTATLAAVAFAGLLVLILRSGEVRGLLMNLVELALTAV